MPHARKAAIALTVLPSLALAQYDARVGGPAIDLDQGGSNRFTVVGLPDTQNYSENYPEIFEAQTRWVARNRLANNIKFVTHYGDLVQHGDDDREWANARNAMDVLHRSGIPYATVAGNHDVTRSGTSGQPYIPERYLANFGPQRFENRSWYQGASPSGMSSYQYFQGGGQEFLALHINVDTPVAELAWAQGVLNNNRDKPVMVTTHRYLQDAEDYTGDIPIVPSGRYPDVWYTIEGTYHPEGIHAEEFFQSFVRTNENIFMVQCGHFHEEYRQTSTNAFGNPVHEVLADYQDDPNGGNGWLRLMEFDVDAKKIGFRSYSPTLDQELFKDESNFSLNVDFDAYRAHTTTATFQQGINGYTGTRDTWINEDSKGSSYGNNDRLVVDDDTTNGWFGDEQAQGLIKFEDIFTDTGEFGKIPEGAEIERATLRITLADDVDFLYDADFDVYTLTRDFDENSTWDTLGEGVGDDLGRYVGRFEGDNDPDGDWWRWIDVTDALQAWADGAPNFGFAILPEIISGNDDGIEIWSSEAGNVLYRPVLDVSYTVNGLIPAPGTAGALALAGACLGIRRRR